MPIVVISRLLGHADPAFTMRIYVHGQGDALKSAAATLQRVVFTSCQRRRHGTLFTRSDAMRS
jgi:integrase